MQFTTVIMAVLATVVTAGPIMNEGMSDAFALDPRGHGVLSIGTSPGCGADCPVCGDETCACGNKNVMKRPCCNGYESTGENLPNCVEYVIPP